VEYFSLGGETDIKGKQLEGKVSFEVGWQKKGKEKKSQNHSMVGLGATEKTKEENLLRGV